SSGVSAAPKTVGADLAASTSGQLLSYVKSKIKESNAQSLTLAVPQAGGVGVSTTSTPTTAAAPASAANPSAFAGTQLQELGVEEDDLVKTDGNMLYALSLPYWSGTATVPAQLQAHQRQADGQLVAAGKLSLDKEVTRSGFYLASGAKRLAVMGQTATTYQMQPALPITGGPTPAILPGAPGAAFIAPIAFKNQMVLDVVSLSTPGSITMSNRVRIDGQLVGSRMVGNILYLVSTWAPDLSRYAMPANASPSVVDAQLASLSSAEILPTLQIDNQAAQPLLADTDCYLQATNASARVQITSITALDIGSASLQRTSRCFVGESLGMYMSTSNVYLSSSRFYTYPTDASAAVFASGMQTDIHKFALQGQQITYKASGTVPGHLGWDREKLPYRMSEYQGDLRVLSFTGDRGWTFPAPLPWILPATQPGSASATVTVTTGSGTAISATPTVALPVSPATLTILRENASQGFDTIGSLPNTRRPAPLGKPGEQVYAVQFVGPRAYVVTFRQTDPLYVLDVSDPADPKALGELAMPGFSDYLYPLGDKLLLGVGKDASNAGQVGGVKVALMDVTDPTQPAVISFDVIGKRGSYSALDFSRHGINIFQQGALFRIALPARVSESPFSSPTYQGLHCYEVDSAAKTMVGKPTLKSIDFTASNLFAPTPAQFDIASDRSVQIGANLYYFSGGAFLTSIL
ncbi:MAG: beta-propeller domain-containing protein, partial [Burkholderiaceae bacterium]